MKGADQDFDRDQWGERVAETAAAFTYPPTPNVASRLRTDAMTMVVAARRRKTHVTIARRMAFALVATIALGGALLAVPPVRAAVVQFLQIGGIRIILVEPTPTPTPMPTLPALAPTVRGPTPTPTATPQPTPTPTPLTSILDLYGETTLDQAQANAGFSIPLPAYPSDLGTPNAVFYQSFDGPIVILIWMDDVTPGRVRMSLLVARSPLVGVKGIGVKGEKAPVRIVRELRVNGQPAYWVEGPHMFQLRNGDYSARWLVNGNVLIWTRDGTTYRLESGLSLDEAVKVAESLKSLK